MTIKHVDPEKAEKEIREMFYTVSNRPENLDNIMASDGTPCDEDIPYLRPERQLDFKHEE